MKPTALLFQDFHTPYSAEFQDIYFSSTNGIEESKHVYLQGSGFLDSLSSPTPSTLAEIGFGVGLNFILSLQAFQINAHPQKKITYLSFEKNPVIKEDLIELYSRFPELTSTAKLLLDQYPLLVPGLHEISLLQGRVRLILALGDATELLPKMDAQVNHWYWDGFAPSKNPDAFSEFIFKEAARLSAPNAIGTSFTAAGWVRRSLESLGFQVEKRPGYGKKRECIRAVFKNSEAKSHSIKKRAPWFSNQNLTLVKPHDTIGIIGAGLAGTAIAHEFLKRGNPVVLIDHHGVANRTSSNPAGLFTHQLSKTPNPISRFSQLALAHSLREIHSRSIKKRFGILQTGSDEELNHDLNSLQTSGYPSSFFKRTEAGIYFSECGILSPQKLCLKRLLGETESFHQNLTLIQSGISEIRKEKSKIHLMNLNGNITSSVDHVIYTPGADFVLPENILKHALLATQPFRSIRGQVIQIKPTSASQDLPYTLIENGYVTPISPEITGNDFHLLGATYLAKEALPNQVEMDNDSLIQDAVKKWHWFSTMNSTNLVSSQIGYRLSTPDKLPLIGPVCDSSWLKDNYLRTLKGSTRESDPELEVSSREWMCLGLGSRGITFSHYAASILVAQMHGEMLPIEYDLWEHLHSARNLIRNLKRSG